jgi:signal transduction histidine kinase/class 3 adenylate cyclase/DNA-binding NtrC family response regulator
MPYFRYLSLLLLLFGLATRLAAEVQPQAVDGLFQVDDWDYQLQGELKLKGEWRFYPDRIFTRDEVLNESFLNEDYKLISMGMDWKKAAGLQREIHQATFVLKVMGLPQPDPLSFRIDQFSQQHQTWLYRPKVRDFVLLAESGRLGSSEETMAYQMKAVHGPLPVEAGEEFYLISFGSRYAMPGNFTLMPVIEPTALMQDDLEKQTMQTFFVLGMFFLLFISNLGLYVLRPADKPSLLIALFTLLMGFRYFSTEALLSRFVPEPSYLTYALTVLSIVWSLCLGFSIYFSFFNLSFKEALPRWIIRGVWALMPIVLLITLISPRYSPPVVVAILAVQVLVSFLLIARLVRLVRKRVRAASMAIAGFALLFMAILNDSMVVFLRVYDFAYLGHYGMVAFIFFQSLVVGSNFAHAFRTAERLSHNLQEEVQQQTEKLRMQKEKLEEQKKILEDQKKQLVEAHDELKDMDEQKTRFFRSISHELRTPLTLILGSLRDRLTSQEIPDAVEVARRNAKRLFRLVNQLLDFQKIALAKFKLRLEPIPLQRFLEGMAGFCTEACVRKKIDFRVTMQTEHPENLKIQGQVDALEKIIFNYLANALKFTPEGGRIDLILERRAHKVRMTVADSGPGIAKEQQGRLFKLFSQVEGSHQQGKQGTGLGLALVKELTQLMHGNVGVDSEAGQGARFWVEFPLLLPDEQTIDILLVDADAKRRLDLIRMLDERAQLWRIKAVADLNEATDVMRREGARVVMTLVDAGPALDDFLKSCQEWQANAFRVLLAESGRMKQDSLQSLNAAQVDHFQVLPFDAEFFRELEQRLHHVADESRPILDLVYVEDEAAIRSEFAMAMERHTVLQQYRTVADGAGLKELLRRHRIRVVIADANLAGEQGSELLAFVAKVSPETFRIILTGETSTEVMAEGIRKAQAHHILYKPCDYRKELQLIEDYIRKSPISDLPEETSASEDHDWHFAGLENSRWDASEQQSFIRPEACKAVILVVDDVYDMRRIVSSMLQAHGYHILTAESGEQALNMVESNPQLIDLVITDWLMPGMDGPALIEALHQKEESVSIPTILLTAKTDTESKAKGIRIGASAWLGKPFDEMELLSMVENLLDLKKRERKIEDLNQFINQNILQRFLPPDLVKDLLAGKAVFDDTARMRPITVIFADLVNFTRSTEILGPARIARILNDFFVRMTDVIFEHGGTIDKFLGDGILIFFGAPQSMDPQEQARRAGRCAEAMMRALDELNKTWQQEFEHGFLMRVGIHHGPAIVGSFGGKRRSDYTAIGNTVNIAARVQANAEPGQILMTSAVRDYLPSSSWRTAGSYQLKGVEGEVLLFALMMTDLMDVA